MPRASQRISNRSDAPASHGHCLFEPLEDRVMLSVALDAGVLSITGSPGADRITLSAGAQNGQIIVQGDPDGHDGTYTNVDAITVDAGAGHDRVRVRGDPSHGGTLRDTAGNLIGVTLLGGEGNDQLTGSAGNDLIEGGPGLDRIEGLDGHDTLRGGDGSDLIDGGDGIDFIQGGNGNDRLIGGNGSDHIEGGAGADQISGGPGNDTLIGGPGNDAINAGEGDDQVHADSGNDHASGGNGNDTVTGGQGQDRIDGGEGNDTLGGDAGNDGIDGDNGDDRIDGDAGNDRIDGGSGNNDTHQDTGGIGDVETLIGFDLNTICDCTADFQAISSHHLAMGRLDTVGAPPPLNMGPQPLEAPRDIWLWGNELLEILDDPAARQVALDFLDEKHITTVYLFAAQIGATGPYPLLDQPALYESLITEMHARGLKVYALFDAVEMDINGTPGASFLNVLLYNHGRPLEQRFDGANLDIEPWLLPDWNTNQPQRVKEYLELSAFYMRAKQLLDPSLLVGPAMPFWFDTIRGVPWNGQIKPLNEHVQDLYDYVTIQDYRDFALGPDGMLFHVVDELDYAEQIGKKVTIAAETGQALFEPEKITFFEEGEAALDSELALLSRALRGNPIFAGFAIHHLGTLRNLIPDGAAPSLAFALANDTGTESLDRLTADPSITGVVTDHSGVASLLVGLDSTNTADFADVTDLIDPNGNFTLTRETLEARLGAPISDGFHLLRMQATDTFANTSDLIALDFELDATTPLPPTGLSLTDETDTGVNNQDEITALATPTIEGQAELGTTVTLFINATPIGEARDLFGWQIPSIELPDGDYTFTATASDRAGNTSDPSQPLLVTVDTTPPDGNLITNGDFEHGNTGFTSEYTLESDVLGSGGSFAIVSDPTEITPEFGQAVSFGDHTSGSGNMMIITGAFDTNRVFWSQSIAVPTNTTLLFSMWVTESAEQVHSFKRANPEVRINGQAIRSFSVPHSPGLWQQWGAQWDSGSSETALIEIVNLHALATVNSFVIDDLRFEVPITVTPPPATPEQIVNGDFESGDIGFDTDYEFTIGDVSPAGSYTVIADYTSTFAELLMTDHTTGSGQMMLVSGQQTPGAVVWAQSVQVVPGTAYTFSMWVASLDAPSFPSQLELLINGEPIKLKQAPTNSYEWRQFAVQWGSDAATSAMIQVVNQNTLGDAYDFALDDITLHREPPPGAPPPSAQVLNGDFEDGDTAFLTDYQTSPGNLESAGSYLVTNNPAGLHPDALSFGDHTTGSGLMMVASAAASPGDTIWSQNVQVTPNTAYAFSMWVATWVEMHFPSELEVRINSALLRTLHTPDLPGEWIRYADQWNSGINTTARIEIIDLSAALFRHQYAFDDISFEPFQPPITPIPIPESVVNGDFEAGNTGFASEYLFHLGGLDRDASYLITPDPSDAIGQAASFGDHTSGSGMMLLVGPGRTQKYTAWSAVVQVEPNTSYDFSMWVASWAEQSYTSEIEIRINDVALRRSRSPQALKQWRRSGIQWDSHSNNTAHIEIVNIGSLSSGNRFALDDIVFQRTEVIPPPPTPPGQLVNPDFDAGNTGFETDYVRAIGDLHQSSTYVLTTDPSLVVDNAESFGGHPSGTGLMMMVNASGPTRVVWSQQVDVELNSDYLFSMWSAVWERPNNRPVIEVRINGVALDEIRVPRTAAQWDQGRVLWESGQSNTALIELIHLRGADFVLDNIMWERLATPELPPTGPGEIVNGDFNFGRAGFSSDYEFTVGALDTDRTFSITPNPADERDSAASFGDHTSGDGPMMMFKGTPLFDELVWAQTVTVEPDTRYAFTMWIATWDRRSHRTYVDIRINGEAIRRVIAPLTEADWRESGGFWESGSDTTALIEIVGATSSSGGDEFALDDLHLAPAPPIAPPPPAPDGLVNGDFEAGNTGFSTDYQFFIGDLGAEGAYVFTHNPTVSHGQGFSFGDHTTGTGLMLMVNGSETPDAVVWSQTLAVQPAETYNFSMWAATWVEPGIAANLQIRINGVPIHTQSAPGTVGVWREITALWDSGSSTTARIEIVDLRTSAFGNDFALDDISWTRVS